MSVYYFDGAQILAPFTINSNEPMFEAETVSLKIQRASQNVQRWELSFEVSGVDTTQVDLLVNSVINLDQVSNMIMPQLPTVDKNYTVSSGDTLVGASADAGSNSVFGNTSNKSGVLPKGSFIKFSNHDKIYLVTSEVNFNTISNPAISIFPSLRVAVTTSNLIKTGQEVLITYKRSIDNSSGITFVDGVLSSLGTINIIEDV